ncbi:hypothetical protein Hanom_Chr07g00621661 [Helianthus anomalus]
MHAFSILVWPIRIFQQILFSLFFLNNWVIIDGALLGVIPLRLFVKNTHNAPLLTGMTRVVQCPWVGALFMCTTTHGLTIAPSKHRCQWLCYLLSKMVECLCPLFWVSFVQL